MFDGSIGAGSVYMPYGGKYQLTETQSMVAKIPVMTGKCDAVTMMSYGFDPYLSSWSPYHGSVYAVLESISKIVAAGGDYKKIRFTFQEYFRRMNEDPKRWSQPFAALLGAYQAQMSFGLPSIGGKDSMSGPSMISMYRRHWFPLQLIFPIPNTWYLRNLRKRAARLFSLPSRKMHMTCRYTARSWMVTRKSTAIWSLERLFPHMR